MKLIAIVGSVTAPGRLLSAAKWLLDDAGESRNDLAAELINLGEKKVSFADGRPPDHYNDDTGAIVRSVLEADGVVLATPVYRGSYTGALKNLLDHLPIESLGGKPVGIVAMGATNHHFLGVDWHLRDVLAWFGALVVPTSVYLSSADFVEGQLAETAKQDLRALASAVVSLTAMTPKRGSFIGPKPLAARRG